MGFSIYYCKTDPPKKTKIKITGGGPPLYYSRSNIILREIHFSEYQ
jgi:hypothetical protein